MSDGGKLVPKQLADEIRDYTELPLPSWLPRTKRPPLTRGQRIRLWFRLLPHRAKWAIHDALFDHPEYDDD